MLNEDLFTLLEREAPSLCADRVDYGIRDSLAFGTLSKEEAKEICDDLIAYEGEIVCGTEAMARRLADACMFLCLSTQL